MAKLKKAKAPADATIEFGWYDPRSLDGNPLNWKDHPPEQGDVIKELIQRHGWIAPLAYNRRTGRLINGHERTRIAIEQGWPAVPVCVVDVPEDQETALLASFDTSGTLARGNPAKLAAILERWKPESASLKNMMDRLAGASGVAAYLAKTAPPQFVADGESSPVDSGSRGGAVSTGGGKGTTDGPLVAAPTYRVPVAHVRMVQLFFDLETQPRFAGWIEKLREQYGTENTSDTVYECVRRAANPTGERAT